VPITEQTNKTQIANSGGDIATVTAQIAAAKKDADAAKARVDQAQAQARLADVDRVRSQSLVKSGAVSQADLDQKAAASEAAGAEVSSAESALKSAEARVTQLEAQVGEAENRLEETKANAPKQVEIQKANVTSREAQIQAAQAALAQAKLNLGYGKIVAPVSGVIGKKSVNVGDHVDPGQPLVAIVQTDDLWVTANFKETQLTRMHPGERVKVSVDAYGTTFTGKVESMPGASGAKYSLFPPENATGNYVKVVQRLPVRVRLDANQPGLDLLRPGMSVEPKVYVR
ncbi:MAG: HlyD family secretion protein, partial [Polyangiaceae bacterium]